MWLLLAASTCEGWSSVARLSPGVRLHSVSSRHGSILVASIAEKAPAQGAAAHDCASVTERARDLLLQMGGRSAPSADFKAKALDELMRLNPTDRDAILDAALDVVSDENSLLARWRFPISLRSRRATIGCFRRLLQQLEAEEPGSGARFQDSSVGRRRRFMLLLFRQARDSASAWELERESRLRRHRASSMEEMLSRTPTQLETPSYEVVSRRDVYEVREYVDFSVVSTTAGRPLSKDGIPLQSPAMSGAGSFQALAGYIFGGNRGNNGSGEKMAMTTPVISRYAGGSEEEVGGTMEMSFVMPSKYWSEQVGKCRRSPHAMWGGSGSMVCECGEQMRERRGCFSGVSCSATDGRVWSVCERCGRRCALKKLDVRAAHLTRRL